MTPGIQNFDFGVTMAWFVAIGSSLPPVTGHTWHVDLPRGSRYCPSLGAAQTSPFAVNVEDQSKFTKGGPGSPWLAASTNTGSETWMDRRWTAKYRYRFEHVNHPFVSLFIAPLDQPPRGAPFSPYPSTPRPCFPLIRG